MRTFLIFPLFLLISGIVFGRSFYIDFQQGNDLNDGLSQLSPLKTITPVQNSLLPGDTLFFKGRTEYEGSISLHSVGTNDSSIIITSYGTGRAIISAGNGYGFYLSSSRNIQIENLIFAGSGRLSGNTKDGVIIEDCQNIYLNQLDITGFQHSGLLVMGTGQNISLTRIHAYNNGFAGIHVYGNYPDRYQCKNIYIGHCQAKNNPGDPTILDNHSGNGIIVGACDSVLIEYCEALENGWDMPRKGNGPVGIWAWHADHVIIQYCISHDNKTAAGAADGGGFDFDGGVTNSFIQYCITYNNEGPGFGIFEYVGASQWKNNTVRYNISINDGTKNGNTCMMFWNGTGNKDLLRDAYIYNNVFYNDRTNGAAISYLDDNHNEILLTNNIFLTKGSLIAGPASNTKYLGNVYWNLGQSFNLSGYSSFQDWIDATGNEMLGDTLVGMNMDPLLTDPGPVTLTDPDSINMRTLSGFLLQEASPLIDKGLDLLNIFGIDGGEHDLFGNEIPSGTGIDRGVHEFQKMIPDGLKENRMIGASGPQEDEWIQVFPNPSDDGIVFFKIMEIPDQEELEVRVVDISGKLIYMENLWIIDGTVRLELPGGYPKGAFCLISVQHKKQIKTFPVIL